jgi:RNA polymerase sigma-70 factor (sigma-E family)
MTTATAEVLDFEEYVRLRQDSLLRSARRLVNDPLDAQDLLQTALVRTYRRWNGIADKSLADAYLRRVMINTRTEWWRSRRLTEVPTDQLPETGRVEDGAEQRADRALLMEVLGTLAPKQRSVVVLRHWEQMSTEETAQALGMSPGTVKSTLHRSLARLRGELERRAEECRV